MKPIRAPKVSRQLVKAVPARRRAVRRRLFAALLLPWSWHLPAAEPPRAASDNDGWILDREDR